MPYVEEKLTRGGGRFFRAASLLATLAVPGPGLWTVARFAGCSGPEKEQGAVQLLRPKAGRAQIVRPMLL